jgi:hypothetical protein
MLLIWHFVHTSFGWCDEQVTIMETVFMLTRVAAFVKVYIQVMNNGL